MLLAEAGLGFVGSEPRPPWLALKKFLEVSRSLGLPPVTYGSIPVAMISALLFKDCITWLVLGL